MRSVFGPLLLGLIPLFAVGCVLPERSFGRAEDLGFRSKGSSSPRVTTEASSTDSLSFKAPSQNRHSNQDDLENKVIDRKLEQKINDLASRSSETDRSQLAPGHSSDVGRSLEKAAWPSTAAKRSTGSSDTVRNDSKDVQNATVRRFPSASADARPNDVRQVAGISDDNSTESPVRQQKPDSSISEHGPTNSKTRGSTENGTATTDSKAGSRPAKTADGNSLPLWSDGPGRSATDSANEARGNNKPSSGLRQTSANGDRSTPGTSTNGTLPALPWQAELEQLIAIAEEDLAQTKAAADGEARDEYVRKQAHLRLMYLMAQRQEDAMTAIAGVDASQQEFWQQLVWAMSNSFDTVQFPDSSERAAQTVPPLTVALRQMREQAALTIKNMTFCRKISYFGNYERFPRNDFTSGHEVLLYTEIENFVSVPTAEGEYRTSLKSQIEITDSQGRIVWTKGFPSTEDFCRNPRRDYFHNYQFYIPEDLSTGTYSLKLTIVDELSKKRASNSLNFVLK